MALQRSAARSETRSKYVYPAAYFRIMAVSNDKNSDVNIRVAAYADKEARLLSDQPSNMPMPGPMGSGCCVLEKSYNVKRADFDAIAIPAGVKPSEVDFAVAYLWLKQQSEFAAAEDC